jgi:predicted nucleic acid-binding protein
MPKSGMCVDAGLPQHFSLRAAYDAHYLALAGSLEAGFWTTDAELVDVVGDELWWVRLVESE